MKRKTTLYLEEEDIIELKRISLTEPNQNMTSLIKKAIRQFIENRKAESPTFHELKRCKNSVKKNYFGDSVDIQRKLRDEWKDH